MLAVLKGLLRLLTARLSRRIVLWVFVSVIVIETIIFIPSYSNRKQELLRHLGEVTSAKVSVIMQLANPDVSDEELLDQVRKLQAHPIILGGALYRSDGKNIGVFGEQPELVFPKINSSKVIDSQNQSGSRYDLVWSPAQLGRDYTLIIRHDASSVKHDLNAFIWRIVGLVVIISIFVTVGAWIALKPVVVTPILKLRRDLIRAGDAIRRDQETPEFHSASIQRQDELGEVIAAFMRMFNQITEAMSERKRAEDSLQESFRQVEAYSKALEHELEKAREIQRNFLPDRIPQPPNWEIAAFFHPAFQVSGDFYDVFPLPGGNVGLVIADVCDKGVGSALFMALFRSLIRVFSGQNDLCELTSSAVDEKVGTTIESQAATHDQINALKAVALTNDYIAEEHCEMCMFATIFFGVLNPATGLLAYINGGHEPVFIVGPAGVKESLRPTGPAVGMLFGSEFEIQQVQLEPGDILIGYTDGVTEARSPSDELFTRRRLQSLLEQPVSSASDLLEHIKINLFTYTDKAPNSDDITMLAVQRAPIEADILPRAC